jgi:hypothetical protein
VNKFLIGLAILVALFVGLFGSRLIPPILIQGQHSIIVILITSILVVALCVLVYLRRELRAQHDRHKVRRSDYGNATKVQRLSPDELAVFSRRIMRNLDMADRKRLVFQLLQNTLLVFAGLLPMLSTIVDSNETQKLLSFGASFSAFLVGLFSMEKFTTEHRRTGFLIEKALNAWLVGNGEFKGLTPADAFRELVNQVQIVLDSSETSFIGAGSTAPPPNLFDQDEPDERELTDAAVSHPIRSGAVVPEEIAQAEALTDFTAIYQDAQPTIDQPQTFTAPHPSRLVGRFSEPTPQTPSRIESGLPESAIAQATRIAPEDFGAWQAAQLGAENYDEITQG